MTVEEILADVDLKYPNDVPTAHKWEWITQLERMLVEECYDTHQISEEEAAKAKEIAAMGTLRRDYSPLAQMPYQEVYTHYVAARIAEMNGDSDSYDRESVMYNNALLTFKNKFNRTHRALDNGQRWRF